MNYYDQKGYLAGEFFMAFKKSSSCAPVIGKQSELITIHSQWASGTIPFSFEVAHSGQWQPTSGEPHTI